MRKSTRILRGVGDRLLDVLVPHTTAHADRYRCWVERHCYNNVWETIRTCCMDDYTGEVRCDFPDTRLGCH